MRLCCHAWGLPSVWLVDYGMKTQKITIEIAQLPPRELSPHRGLFDLGREMAKGALKGRWRSWAYFLALEQLKGKQLRWERARISVTIYAKDRRNIWDADNLIAALDPVADGLVDAQLLRDDRGVEWAVPRWVLGKEPRTVIEVEEIAPAK